MKTLVSLYGGLTTTTINKELTPVNSEQLLKRVDSSLVRDSPIFLGCSCSSEAEAGLLIPLSHRFRKSSTVRDRVFRLMVDRPEHRGDSIISIYKVYPQPGSRKDPGERTSRTIKRVLANLSVWI